MARPRLTLDLRRAAGVLAQGDPEHLTMAQVARALGVAKPTLYRLATSKEALLTTVADAETERLLDHVHAAVTADPGQPLEALVSALLAFAADSPAGMRLLFEHRTPAARAARRRIHARVCAELGAAGEREAAVAGLVGLAAAATLHAQEAGWRTDGATLAGALRALMDGER